MSDLERGGTIGREPHYEEAAMATYIVLGEWTEQGVKNAKDTTDRADKASELAQRMGGAFKQIWWTLGKYDVVAVVEFPDDTLFAAWGLALAKEGNIRTTSARAFTRSEMQGIIDKAG